MAEHHDGEAQFTAEATMVMDDEARADQARLEEIEREAVRLRAKTTLAGKANPTVIGEDGTVEGGGEVEKVEEVWKYGTLEYKGDVWEYRVPKPLAAMFLGAASRKSAKAGRKIDAIMGYLEHVLSSKSVDRMMERAQDHEDEFDTEHMAELVKLISQEGSARPTGSIRR